jgi:poly-gamma-glutamate synthesis protein (capsule biosynthesis protein)
MLRFKNGSEIFRKSEGEQIKISITGDVCPRNDALEYIKSGKSHEILNNIQPFLDKADLRIAQWETPLTNTEFPIDKSGPNIKCPPECITFAKAAHFDIVLLANNHIGDYGTNSILETINIFEKNNIKTVGAGKDLREACKPLLVEKKGFKVSIINIAEHEFGTAGINNPGCAPLEPFENIKLIQECSIIADIVLVVVHGGNEHNPIPSPRMIKTYRAFAEAGASAVINIHTHCPQGIELWQGVPIIYCPGNFFFPSNYLHFDITNFWWIGYLPILSFDRGGVFAIEIVPYFFNSAPCRITPFRGRSKEKFCEYLAEISAIIRNAQEVEAYFDAWCLKNGNGVLSAIREYTAKWPIDLENNDQVKELLPLRNLSTCESHNEVTTNFLRMIGEHKVNVTKKILPQLDKLSNAIF